MINEKLIKKNNTTINENGINVENSVMPTMAVVTFTE